MSTELFISSARAIAILRDATRHPVSRADLKTLADLGLVETVKVSATRKTYNEGHVRAVATLAGGATQ